jgi:hypothetical protein
MSIRSFSCAVLLLVAVCCAGRAFSTPPEPSGPHLTDIILTTSESDLLLFGELRNSVTPAMEEGLYSGIPIRFTFFVSLEKSQSGWFDEELASLNFSHTLSFDTLKETYVVETEENGGRRHTVRSYPEALQLLNEFIGMRIIALAELAPDTKYRLRIKADLHKKTLPLALHTVVPFISWWDLDTDWYTVEFMY